jgi:hypothetical protein
VHILESSISIISSRFFMSSHFNNFLAKKNYRCIQLNFQ